MPLGVRLIRVGSNRNVLLVGKRAIKFPKCWPLRRIRKALKANRLEASLYREQRHVYPELCPVLALSPFGVVLVMARARMMTADEYAVFVDSKDYPDRQAYPYEEKPDEWGFVDGRRVVVDYAKEVHEDDFENRRAH